MSILTAHLAEVGRTSPAVFFDEVCSLLMRARREFCRQTGGVYGFELSGAEGGKWTVDFDALAVHPTVSSSADVTVKMRARDFAKLLNDSVDFATCEGLAVEGDHSMLMNMARFAEPLN